MNRPRVRISTLMFLVVIAGLGAALVVQAFRHKKLMRDLKREQRLTVEHLQYELKLIKASIAYTQAKAALVRAQLGQEKAVGEQNDQRTETDR